MTPPYCAYGRCAARCSRPRPSSHVHSITIAGNDVEAGFRLRPLPASGSQLPGFALEPLIPSQFPLTLQLAEDIALRLLAGTTCPTCSAW
jgi:hypothetical protein